MKKIYTLLIIAVAVLYFSFTGNLFAQEKTLGKIKIGIIKFSNLPYYNSALKGILKELKSKGYDETKVIFDIQDGGGKKDKVIEIAKDFNAKGVNLIIPIGSPAAVEVFNEVKDIPIVYSGVFNPIELGLAKSWEISGTNATGSSSWVEMNSLLDALRKILPFKSLGVIYTQEETQSVFQLEECKKLQEKMGFKVIAANLSQASDLFNIHSSLIGQVDAIFISGGTPITKYMSSLIELTTTAKIPMVSFLADRVEQGALLAVSANFVQLGELTGNKAALVLGGAKPSEIPIEKVKIFDITINLDTATTLGLIIPREMLSTAAKVIKD